ncbi:AfsR/SARP family transcriptional regulator [Sphaerisporangium fuscum]|uniref:AfsR/SARP family transcriptional regulator n=1 Tax=Sphaerisporangium fuscum TaxID=2835868 RepID=UPI001BDC7E75|nr:BTAD domain-containing putative transcriptional regulator [Sphaerisporangium fuscum]
MEYRVLGPVGLWRDGRLTSIVGQKQRTLLAVLVLHANHVVSHDRLLTALWGVEIPVSGRKLLQNHVWSLRRSLADPGRLTGTPAGYCLQIPPSASDLDVFTAETDAARKALAAGDAQQAADRLRGALALWRGTALAGTRDELQLTDGAALEERRVAAFGDRIEADLALGRHDDLIGELRRLVVDYPLQERLRGQLMLALHRSGRTAEALEEYRLGCRHLREEFGLEPGADISRLHQAILAADPHDAMSTCGQAATAPGTAAASRPVPRQLPPHVSRFTGRVDSLRLLDSLLGGAENGHAATISVIAGTAGVGKTALATYWAHSVADRFPDGQLFLNLHGYSHGERVAPGQALQQLLLGLGVAREAIPHLEDERVGLYRTLVADKHMLIVLDNAATPQQVRPLLPGSPHCKVVITSRDSLRGLAVTHDVHTFALGMLTAAEAKAFLMAQLGAERLGAHAGELARLCGGLPLALRLASAHLHYQPELRIQDFMARLREENPLSALEIDEDPGVGVRATFELSYRALPDMPRRAFRLLGHAPGPDIDLDAVAVLVDATPAEARKAVDVLVNAHLVHRVGARLAMHDLLRVYARDRSAVEDSERERRTALTDLLSWFIHSSGSAVAHVSPGSKRLDPGIPLPRNGKRRFTRHDDALAWLETERETLVASIGFAASAGWPGLAWRLAHTLTRFFYSQDYIDDWITTHEVALSAARGLDDNKAENLILCDLAYAYLFAGQYAKYLSHQRCSLQLCRSAGDESGEASALQHLGYGLLRTGELAAAIEAFTQALAKHRGIADLDGEMESTYRLACAYLRAGRTTDAADLLNKCISHFRKAGKRYDEAYASIYLADAHGWLGDFSSAVERALDALRVGRELRNSRLEADALSTVGRWHRKSGRLDDALACQRRALSIVENLSTRELECEILLDLGDTFLAMGERRDALESYKAALVISRGLKGSHLEGLALRGIGDVDHSGGNSERAAAYWRKALDILSSMHVPEAEVVAAKLRGIAGTRGE